MSQQHQGRQPRPSAVAILATQGPGVWVALTTHAFPVSSHCSGCPDFPGPISLLTPNSEQPRSSNQTRFHSRRGNLFGTVQRVKSSEPAFLVAMK